MAEYIILPLKAHTVIVFFMMAALEMAKQEAKKKQDPEA